MSIEYGKSLTMDQLPHGRLSPGDRIYKRHTVSGVDEYQVLPRGTNWKAVELDGWYLVLEMTSQMTREAASPRVAGNNVEGFSLELSGGQWAIVRPTVDGGFAVDLYRSPFGDMTEGPVAGFEANGKAASQFLNALSYLGGVR